MGKMTSFIWVFIMIWIGGIIAGFITPLIPQIAISGWNLGIITAFIQVLILAFVGILIKMDLWTLLVSTVLLFVGGLFGGLIAQYFVAFGLWNTIIIIAVQTIFLMLTGFVKKSPSIKGA